MTVLVFAALASLAVGHVHAQSNCQALNFTVSGTAQNKNLTGILNNVGSLAALQAFYNAAPFITVSGQQTLAGVYCKPNVTNSNNTKLEVLFHSISGDHTGFTALGGVGSDFPQYQPELYSWTQYANNLGYPTLAIDRLGNGRSSHPDPILVVQAAYEIELYNNLATQIRAGTTKLPQKYTSLSYIGNSYGSQLGTGIAGKHPAAYDQYVLTGFTSSVQKGFAGVLLVDAEPAQIVDPARFGKLPVGYLTTASQVGRTASFFGNHSQVSFTDTVAQLFFDRKDVVSAGQFASVYAFPFNGAGFTGRVFTLDGEQDQPFCGLGSSLLGPASCGSQPQQTGALFPNAKYNYKTVNQIGHAVQLHLRSQVLFQAAHQFLGGQSFAGGTPLKKRSREPRF